MYLLQDEGERLELVGGGGGNRTFQYKSLPSIPRSMRTMCGFTMSHGFSLPLLGDLDESFMLLRRDSASV